jgi:hypothetical protein
MALAWHENPSPVEMGGDLTSESGDSLFSAERPFVETPNFKRQTSKKLQSANFKRCHGSGLRGWKANGILKFCIRNLFEA